MTDNNLKLTIQQTNTGVIIQVKVIPGSSRSEISEILDGVLKIKLNSPPVDGQANKECIKLLSKTLKVPKSNIKIISGEKSRNKSLLIGISEDGLRKVLDKILNK